MTPAQAKAMYRRLIERGEIVHVRRYVSGGVNRPVFEVHVRARVTNYGANELVGNIQQGDRRVIMLADDLIEHQFRIPLTPGDKVVVRGKECAIISPDDSTRRIEGVLVAYDLQVRG